MNTDVFVFGVIGDPVKHSLSPFMHNFAFKLSSFNGIYAAFNVKNIAEAITGIRGLGIRGLSVTIPHKESVIPYVDSLTESAVKIGAVNTITNLNGVIEGDNTDWIGIVRSLKENTPIKDKKVLVIGAGGASRAVCFGIEHEGGELFICNRTPEKGRKLAEEFNGKYIGTELLKELKPDIIINTTSVGMYPKINASPVDKNVFSNCCVALDIVYNPIETKFLNDARKQGAKTISGIGMFVYQGGAQFEKWTGIKFPVQAIKEKIFKKLIKRG